MLSLFILVMVEKFAHGGPPLDPRERRRCADQISQGATLITLTQIKLWPESNLPRAWHRAKRRLILSPRLRRVSVVFRWLG